MLSFSVNELYRMYAAYNGALGVWQFIMYVPMIVLAGFAFVGKERMNAWISLFLGALWIWVGVVFHFLFYSDILAAANYYSLGFVLQGLLIIWEGIKEKNLWFGYRGGYCAVTGLLFVLYALIGYPLIGMWLGQEYPRLAVLLFPVPVTIFTFGMLLWTYKRVPEYLLIIPIVWSIVGTTLATLGLYQDLGLLASGVISAVMIHRHNRIMKRNI
jgi:hypothetical protein